LPHARQDVLTLPHLDIDLFHLFREPMASAVGYSNK
jgi:hypothetical protein